LYDTIYEEEKLKFSQKESEKMSDNEENIIEEKGNTAEEETEEMTTNEEEKKKQLDEVENGKIDIIFDSITFTKFVIQELINKSFDVQKNESKRTRYFNGNHNDVIDIVKSNGFDSIAEKIKESISPILKTVPSNKNLLKMRKKKKRVKPPKRYESRFVYDE